MLKFPQTFLHDLAECGLKRKAWCTVSEAACFRGKWCDYFLPLIECEPQYQLWKIPLNLWRLFSGNKLAQGTKAVEPHQEGLEELLDLGLNDISTKCQNSTPEPIDIDW